MSRLPGKPLSENDRKEFYDGLARAQREREAKDFPPAGKSYQELMKCPHSKCKGSIMKETEVSYPNPESRMGGPPITPRFTHRAFCNKCAILFALDVLERTL